MNTLTTQDFSNPFAFLPAAAAARYQASCYVFTINLTAYVYDWLLSMSEEHAIMLKAGLSRSNLVYFVSRIASLGHVISTALYATTPFYDCLAVNYAATILSAISTLSTSFLFLLRVRAVYQNSRSITVLFGFFWVVMLGLSVLIVYALHTTQVPHTHYCIYTTKRVDYFAIPSSITCTNDTFVFLAISYRLAGNAATERGGRARIRALFTGEGLYSFSRSILQTGQLYYLATIAFFVANLTMIASPPVPLGLRYIFVPSYCAFTNIMACHVFRGVALGVIDDSALTTTKIAAAFRSAPHNSAETTVGGTIYEIS